MKKIIILLGGFFLTALAQFSYAACDDAYYECHVDSKFVGYVSPGGATNFVDATPPLPYFPMWYHFPACYPGDSNTTTVQACKNVSEVCQKYFGPKAYAGKGSTLGSGTCAGTPF